MSITFVPESRLIIENNVGGDNSISIVSVYSLWKQWFQQADNSKWPIAFRVVGGDPLSDVKQLGATFFLVNGWRFKPAEYSHNLELVGNLFTDPAGDRVYVPTDGNYTVSVTLSVSNLTDATIQQLPEIEYSSFNGVVTMDFINGLSGTGYTLDGRIIGTPRAPSNNWSDGLFIMNARGLTTFAVLGDASLSGYDFSNINFIGESKNKSIFTLDPSANLFQCEFVEAEITGTLDGDCVVSDCVIKNINYISGFIERCVLEAGTITLGGGGVAHFLDCWSGVPGQGTVIIDFGGSGQALAMRNYSGGAEMRNKTGPEAVSIDLNSGQIILDSTVANSGPFVVRGVGKLTDNSVNTTVDSTDLISGNEINLIKYAVAGNAEVSNDNLTVYIKDDDGNTIRTIGLSADGRIRSIQ